jgi:quinol monooxygenase YgiN
MTQIVIVCYQPKEGKEAELKALVQEHVPILRAEQMATDREPVMMQAANGTIIEVFEWVSAEAIQKAHTSPVVQAMWQRFNEACTYVAPDTLAECQHIFSTFKPMD